MVQLQCLAHGTPPLRYEWTKANSSLPGHATVRESVLHISPAAPHDSGAYLCRVSNRVGSAEAVAHVRVQGEDTGKVQRWCSQEGKGGGCGQGACLKEIPFHSDPCRADPCHTFNAHSNPHGWSQRILGAVVF